MRVRGGEGSGRTTKAVIRTFPLKRARLGGFRAEMT